MTAKVKTKGGSRILATVHASAAGMHAAGLIDASRMREFDALCLASRPADTGDAAELRPDGQAGKRKS